jgi:hypothetical protein
MDRTAEPPFPNCARTGRAFITPCCTAGVFEFLIDSQHWLSGHVAGHGWSKPWTGQIEDINDTGTLVDQDGTERRIWWRSDREKGYSPAMAWPVTPPADLLECSASVPITMCVEPSAFLLTSHAARVSPNSPASRSTVKVRRVVSCGMASALT